MSQQYLRRFWLLMVLSILVVLTACGGAGGEAPKPKLTDSDYVLEIAGQLEASEFDRRPALWVQTIKEIPADVKAWSWDWYQPGFGVAEDGRYTISVDAREIVGQALDPERFAKMYLWSSDDEVIDVSVSDDTASLRALHDIVLHQRDPATVDEVASHSLDFLPAGEWGRPVFSDSDVRIQGTVGAPASTPRMKIDLSLKAGWNLVYIEPGSRESATEVTVARPLTVDDQPKPRLTSTVLVSGTDDAFAGSSVFPAHQLQDDVSPAFLTGNAQSREIKVRSWVSSGDARIVPLGQAFPGTGSVEPSKADSRGLLAAFSITTSQQLKLLTGGEVPA